MEHRLYFYFVLSFLRSSQLVGIWQQEVEAQLLEPLLGIIFTF